VKEGVLMGMMVGVSGNAVLTAKGAQAGRTNKTVTINKVCIFKVFRFFIFFYKSVN
jgi:hypothetical protein